MCKKRNVLGEQQIDKNEIWKYVLFFWKAKPHICYIQTILKGTTGYWLKREAVIKELDSSVGWAPARSPEVVGSNPALVNFSLFIQNRKWMVFKQQLTT